MGWSFDPRLRRSSSSTDPVSIGAGISAERIEDQVSGDAIGSGERDQPKSATRGERLRNSELQELMFVAGVLDRKP
jgi:hypothetical protein